MRQTRKRLRVAVLAAGLLGFIGVETPFAAIYLSVNNLEIRGEANPVDPSHRDWIEVFSFSHGLQNLGCPSAGGKGNTTFTDFVFTKELDRATPRLIQEMDGGRTYPAVEFHFTRSGGAGEVVFQEYEFTNARFQTVQLGGNDDFSAERGSEGWSLNYTSVTIRYFPLDAKGLPGTPVVVTLNVSTCP